MRQPRMEYERLGLPKCIDYAVQEAHKESRVEIHRTRSVQENDQAQRFGLALAPGKINRSAAMRHATMNSAAQIKAAPSTIRLLPPNEPRPHHLCQPRSQRVHGRDIGRIDDMAEVGVREIVVTRGAFATAAAVLPGRIALAPLHTIRVVGAPWCR